MSTYKTSKQRLHKTTQNMRNYPHLLHLFYFQREKALLATSLPSGKGHKRASYMYVHNESTLISAALFSKPGVDSFTAYPRIRCIFRLNSFIIVFEIKNENQLVVSYPAVPFLSFWGEEFRGDTKRLRGRK